MRKLAVAAPLFDTAEVDVGGRTLRIRAVGNGAEAPYVRSVRWNGKPRRQNWIAHADLAKGGELVFEMSSEPTRFGADRGDRPPSFGRGAA